MERCVVLDLPGLSARYVGPSTPNMQAFVERGRMVRLQPILPALNCTMQATFLTGRYPSEHGIVGDGWLHRELGEVRFWPQSDGLVQTPQLWDAARKLDPSFTCARVCWFMNMYSKADYAITPQPSFTADGRVVPDVFTEPLHLRKPLVEALGNFPAYDYWGPRYSIRSSEWIADVAMWLEQRHGPTLSLVFLPHLDYTPHTFGPDAKEIHKSLREIDDVVGKLIGFYESRGVRVIILSEFGAVPVSRAVHLNRLFRRRGWLAIREEGGRDVVYPSGSEAFAVADMQIAHIYVRNPALLDEVKALVEAEPGVAQVLDAEGKRAHHLDHPRSGELVALAEPDAWFTYFYWLDDARAPDYARTVDIYRKPGYDPLEMFVDPKLGLRMLELGGSVVKEKLGVRSRLEVVSMDGSLLKGAHGLPTGPEDGPVLLTRHGELIEAETLHATQVHDLILAHLTRQQAAA
ncbi:alkaline phosphatase family protein [Myxococcus sp. AB056]|uniref:alkaline phosphatase family protein n=1 Tax=Myxococcus sp. AB056 TaxID=2562792 RepID=UPI0011469374|nr:nucleotide pyrophosphatase/phosphodiesterase family protein [Myxococcus sp. AB056]